MACLKMPQSLISISVHGSFRRLQPCLLCLKMPQPIIKHCVEVLGLILVHLINHHKLVMSLVIVVLVNISSMQPVSIVLPGNLKIHLVSQIFVPIVQTENIVLVELLVASLKSTVVLRVHIQMNQHHAVRVLVEITLTKPAEYPQILVKIAPKYIILP